VSENADVLIEFIGVEKTYDGKSNVVKNLDLSILNGEFLTLLGPSGSGKTTTLMMLAGFEEPTAGDILLRGNSLRRIPPYSRNMGVVFQNYALFPHKTVGENVAYPLIQRRLAKSEVKAKTARALEMVELDHLAERHPRQLSGGQQQRVALARALVFEPELVLMDEPLGALDKKLREQMQIEIKHLHDALKMTVVYVTHDQSEALSMSDRVAIFNDGIVQQISDPWTIYESPNTSFVANFIGENNTLDGTVEATTTEICHVALDIGGTVEARAINIDGVGSRTSLSVRPERLHLAAAGDACANRLTVKVVEKIYGGDHSLVALRHASGTAMVARVTAAEAIDISPGQQLAIGWDSAHCRALDPQPTSTGNGVRPL
jgi:putative spermidine/putrescine transport system ATP-binding protein